MTGVFIVGAPCSGAERVGRYLGSGTVAVNLGESGAFELAYRVAPARLGEIPGPFRDDYLSSLKGHARAFAEERAAELGREWYCETTLTNALVADQLARDLPKALFVLVLRHYSGAIQSARRTEHSAEAASSWEQSAERWARCYEAAGQLPSDRTIVVSYEALAQDPEHQTTEFRGSLEAAGLETESLDERVLRQTSLAETADGGTRDGVSSTGFGFDSRSWSGDLQRMVWPVVCDVHRELQQRFGSAYHIPPKPVGLKTHDEVVGLVPVELADW